MHQDFINVASRTIYEEATKTLNQIITGSKTSAVAIGLYLNLPIQVELRRLPADIKVKPKLSELATNVSAYLKHDDKTKVMFAFYYSEDKQIAKLYKLLEDPKAGAYFAYLYCREVMRVAQNHNTFAHYSMLRPKLEKSNILADQYLFYVNAASHYAINIFIKAIFETVNDSNLRKWTEKIFNHQLYTAAYENLTIPEILDELIANQAKLGDIEHYDELTFVDGVPHNDHTCINDKFDAHITDVGETLTDTIRTFGRGTASMEIFEKGFKAIKVKTGWFNKFKTAFNRIVYYKTEEFSSSWSSLNSTYRHKFKSPAKKFEDKSLSIILTVDQSGSQSDEALGKMLHVINKKADQIADLTILIHDTEIRATGKFSGSSIKDNPEVFKLMSNRICSGGTSHYHTTKYIVDAIKSGEINPEQTIYMSYSDNMSDIPEVLAKFPEMKQIETIWVCDINNPLPAECGGTNITLV